MSVTDVARIGIIVAGPARPIEGFKEGLAEAGWVEGRNVSFELRAAQGQLDRLPGFAAEMVGLDVDVIAVIGAITVRVVRQATSTIPIVFSVVVEPVGDGLATDLRRPGGNVTGVTSFDPDQARTQLELLELVKPSLVRVAILSDRGVSECLSRSNREAARLLGMAPQVLRVAGPAPDYEAAFASMDRERAEALVVLEEPINAACREQIADLALAHRLPTVFPREQADAGGLFGYGTSLRAAARAMAPNVDRILKGARPGDLPIEAARRHELVVNRSTAAKLGVTVPPDLLARADEIIG